MKKEQVKKSNSTSNIKMSAVEVFSDLYAIISNEEGKKWAKDCRRTENNTLKII